MFQNSLNPLEGWQKNAQNKEVLFQRKIIKNHFNEQVEWKEKDKFVEENRPQM